MVISNASHKQEVITRAPRPNRKSLSFLQTYLARAAAAVGGDIEMPLSSPNLRSSLPELIFLGWLASLFFVLFRSQKEHKSMQS